MNIKIITLILLLFFPIYASSEVVIVDNNKLNNYKKTKKALKVVAAIKTVKFVKKHPVVSVAGSIVAYDIYKKISVKEAVKRISKKTEDLDWYLEEKPKNINKFVSITIDLFENSTNTESSVRYGELLKLLAVDVFENPDLIIDLNKTKEDQEDIEKDRAFLEELDKLEKIANNYDNDNPKKCTDEDRKRIFNTVGRKFNEENNKRNIIFLNDNLPSIYNVDSYNNLKGLAVKIERDHIPSYKALELHFLKKYPIDLIKQQKHQNRYYYLSSNATAISLPYKDHRNNRTTGIRNSYFSKIDANFLRLATLKDYATILYITRNDEVKYNQLFSSFLILYKRNKDLCIYD